MKTDIRSRNRSPVPDLTVREPNRQAAERAERLRHAARIAGGNVALARLSGIPLGTLNKYLAGGEMKLTAATALAEAAKVSLEWLATGADSGEKPAVPSANTAPPRTPAPSNQSEQPRSIFSQIDIDKLTAAYDAVTDRFENDYARLETRPLLQAVILLYDMLVGQQISVTITQHDPEEPAGHDAE